MEIPRQNLISFRIPFIWKGNPWCSELERIFTAADLKSVTTLTQIPRPTAETRINMGLIHVKTATFIKSAWKLLILDAYAVLFVNAEGLTVWTYP